MNSSHLWNFGGRKSQLFGYLFLPSPCRSFLLVWPLISNHHFWILILGLIEENNIFSDANIYSCVMVLSEFSIFEKNSRKGFK